MIKALAEQGDGSPLIILGLSDMNMKLLKEEKPIVVELSELGLPGKIVIIGGGTEDDLANMLRHVAHIEVERDLRTESEKRESYQKDEPAVEGSECSSTGDVEGGARRGASGDEEGDG